MTRKKAKRIKPKRLESLKPDKQTAPESQTNYPKEIIAELLRAYQSNNYERELRKVVHRHREEPYIELINIIAKSFHELRRYKE